MADTKSYSAGDPAMLDMVGRSAQAEKILAVVDHFVSSHPATMRDAAFWHCLDVGCSVGTMARVLARRYTLAIGVDLDQEALRYRAVRWTPPAYPSVASALALPCKDASIDLVICNQVYQYVPDVAALFTEIHRVLRPGQICFFSGRNRWGIVAQENRLPWLAVLAPRLVNHLERQSIANREWRHRAGQLWPAYQLRALADRYFTVIDYTTRVLLTPVLARLYLPDERHRKLARLLNPILPLSKPVLPTHLWILVKP